MDFLYAELKEKLDGVIKLTEGVTTETAKTTVNNELKTVSVDVLGCPGTFSIQLDEEGHEVVTYNGSVDVLWNFYSIISQYVKILDIVDNLSTDLSDKPLSAKQGKILKEFIESSLLDYYTKAQNDELLDLKEDISNKVTSLSAQSTNKQYPSAKCVYDIEQRLQSNIDNKQDTLTFDNTPTQNSNNPVKSGGVYSELATCVRLADE